MKNVDSNCRIATAGRGECEGDSKRVNAARPQTHTHTHILRQADTQAHIRFHIVACIIALGALLLL